jgi:hypothetical protein
MSTNGINSNTCLQVIGLKACDRVTDFLESSLLIWILIPRHVRRLVELNFEEIKYPKIVFHECAGWES